METTHIRTN